MFKVTGPLLPPVVVVVLLPLLLHLSENVGYRWVHSDWVFILACRKTALVDTGVELLALVYRSPLVLALHVWCYLCLRSVHSQFQASTYSCFCLRPRLSRLCRSSDAISACRFPADDVLERHERICEPNVSIQLVCTCAGILLVSADPSLRFDVVSSRA